MATVVKDLGAVTAYAYAVAGGYSGTEAEFEALLGNIAEDLSEIENLSVTVTTLPAGSSATASYSNGVLSLGIPKGDKGDKGDTGATGATGPTGNGISTITKTGTSGLVDTYTITFTNGDTTTFTVTNGEDGEVTTAQMNAAIETALEDYAKVDGSYSSLTAGNAEQLVSTVGVEDKTPYLFRTTGGSADVGDRVKVSEITGGTVAWNQLQANTKSYTTQGTTYTYNNGKLTIKTDEGGATANNWWLTENDEKWDWIANHVYLVDVGNSTYSFTAGLVAHWYLPAPTGYASININKPVAIIKPTFTTNVYLQFVVYSGLEVDTTFIPQVFDLTQMFGSTIADYIYSLEQNTEGAGVAWFRKLFPKDYYAYDAGSLLSVKTTAHKEVWFNQWDEEWEVGYYSNDTGGELPGSSTIRTKNYIPVIPKTTYYAKSPNGVFPYLYDKNFNFLKQTSGSAVTGARITNNTFTIPDDAYYLRFSCPSEYGTTYNHDICINLHWDGERDGEYEPYELHTYAIDDVELRGIPKLDASNNLYYDGDGYAPDGTVTRRFGTISISATQDKYGTWDSDTGKGAYWYTTLTSLSLPSIKGLNTAFIKGFVFYSNVSTNTVYTSPTITIYDNGIIRWVDPSHMADDKTTYNAYLANNPIVGIYELATPTTESADPYQETQVCNDFGTEEFVDSRTVPMPVGANALYQANLRAKLEMAPDSPDGDGDYIVRQTDGLNEYVAVSGNSTISGLSARCPACPTDTDGNFVLKATVSSGSVTYSWVAEA